MKNINFKHPKYLFPLFLLPLIIAVYSTIQSHNKGQRVSKDEDSNALQANLSSTPEDQRDKNLKDKLSAYKDYFVNDKNTASGVELLEGGDELFNSNSFPEAQYDDKEYIESMNFSPFNQNENDSYTSDSNTALALKLLEQQQNISESPAQAHTPQEDPLDQMRKQFELLDSFQRASDPDYKSEILKQEKEKQREEKKTEFFTSRQTVSKENRTEKRFNTIFKSKESNLIKAIIDESITIYPGSRVRIKLLEDIFIDNKIALKKGHEVYAIATGFSAQRVNLDIHSIHNHGEIYPVNLKIYDTDGLEGLYVPNSNFRELTTSFGSTSVQGFDLSTESSDNTSRFLLSPLQRAFQSTTSAISKNIRANKAKLKYSTHLYLMNGNN